MVSQGPKYLGHFTSERLLEELWNRKEYKFTPEGVSIDQSRQLLFYDWMVERQHILNRKNLGLPQDEWTSDPILKEYKFTNVFRQEDRVTQHYMRWIRPMIDAKDDWWRVWFNTIMYRIINWPPTMNELGLITCWKRQRGDWSNTMRLLTKGGAKVYTGAYMITAERITGQSKWISTRKTLDCAWKYLEQYPRLPNNLFTVTEVSSRFPRVGGFIGYEVACDLSYFYYPFKDTNTWANPGPGAVRGLNRIMCRKLTSAIPMDQAVKEMKDLFIDLRDFRDYRVDWSHPLDMRCIEHSLCEFDKYMRVFLGEGKPRAKYKPFKGEY